MGKCTSKVKHDEKNIEETFIENYIKTLQDINTNTFILNQILNHDFEKLKRNLIQEYKQKINKNYEDLDYIKNNFKDIGIV